MGFRCSQQYIGHKFFWQKYPTFTSFLIFLRRGAARRKIFDGKASRQQFMKNEKIVISSKIILKVVHQERGLYGKNIFLLAREQKRIKKYPGLSSHRYSVIFSADSKIFEFSAMFRAVSADFNFYISGHN